MPGSIVPLRTAPWTLVTVDGIVSNVLDLTDASILKALGTNVQEMTGTWAKGANPPAHELAQAAYGSGQNRRNQIRLCQAPRWREPRGVSRPPRATLDGLSGGL